MLFHLLYFHFIDNSFFPAYLQLAIIKLVHIQGSKDSKENYDSKNNIQCLK